MAENDLSRIVSLIMENPKLIEEIKNLGSEKPKTEEANAVDIPIQEIESAKSEAAESTPAVSFATPSNNNRARRKDLLCALKPYVSEERCKAIESMLSIVDILDMMKTR